MSRNVLLIHKLFTMQGTPGLLVAGRASLKAVTVHAAELNGDAQRLFVAGESAGGNLATVMCLLAKENGQPDLLKAQVCISPVYDMVDFTRQSYVDFKDDEFEDAKSIEVMPVECWLCTIYQI